MDDPIPKGGYNLVLAETVLGMKQVRVSLLSSLPGVQLVDVAGEISQAVTCPSSSQPHRSRQYKEGSASCNLQGLIHFQVHAKISLTSAKSLQIFPHRPVYKRRKRAAIEVTVNTCSAMQLANRRCFAMLQIGLVHILPCNLTSIR